MSELMETDKPYRKVMIAGGGNIGARLAGRLEGKYRVQLIERDANRTRELSELLSKAIVNIGDASSRKLLDELVFGETDVFCAVTNPDEANIMASMLAKKMGACKVMTLINNPAYVDLVQGGLIDVAVSPEQATIGSILRHVRRGEIQQAFSLRRGAAEALELIARGEQRAAAKYWKTIDDRCPRAPLSEPWSEEEVLMGHNYITIQPDDHVIVFLAEKNPRKLTEIERMFQPGTEYLPVVMRYLIIGKILGLLLAVFSIIATAPAIVVAIIYQEDTLLNFAASFLTLFMGGGLMWSSLCRDAKATCETEMGFLSPYYSGPFSMLGSLPLVLMTALNMSVTDAVFESISGLTTTGATVISGLDDLPRSILFTANFCNGWAESGSSFWRWPCCHF